MAVQTPSDATPTRRARRTPFGLPPMLFVSTIIGSFAIALAVATWVVPDDDRRRRRRGRRSRTWSTVRSGPRWTAPVEKGQPAPDTVFEYLDGEPGLARRLRRPTDRPQLLGLVVRALPEGDARVRTTAPGARRRDRRAGDRRQRRGRAGRGDGGEHRGHLSPGPRSRRATCSGPTAASNSPTPSSSTPTASSPSCGTRCSTTTTIRALVAPVIPNGLSALVDADRLAYAFTVGMVAAVNPCGFALLPAYLAYYLGLTDDTPEARRTDSGTAAALVRAVWVSLCAHRGLRRRVRRDRPALDARSTRSIGGRLPWVTAVMGLGLVVLGVAMLAGFEPMLKLPRLDVGKGSQQVWSVFLFGDLLRRRLARVHHRPVPGGRRPGQRPRTSATGCRPSSPTRSGWVHSSRC